jgi:hypothetical protein
VRARQCRLCGNLVREMGRRKVFQELSVVLFLAGQARVLPSGCTLPRVLSSSALAAFTVCSMHRFSSNSSMHGSRASWLVAQAAQLLSAPARACRPGLGVVCTPTCHNRPRGARAGVTP